MGLLWLNWWMRRFSQHRCSCQSSARRVIKYKLAETLLYDSWRYKTIQADKSKASWLDWPACSTHQPFGHWPPFRLRLFQSRPAGECAWNYKGLCEIEEKERRTGRILAKLRLCTVTSNCDSTRLSCSRASISRVIFYLTPWMSICPPGWLRQHKNCFFQRDRRPELAKIQSVGPQPSVYLTPSEPPTPHLPPRPPVFQVPDVQDLHDRWAHILNILILLLTTDSPRIR